MESTATVHQKIIGNSCKVFWRLSNIPTEITQTGWKLVAQPGPPTPDSQTLGQTWPILFHKIYSGPGTAQHSIAWAPPMGQWAAWPMQEPILQYDKAFSKNWQQIRTTSTQTVRTKHNPRVRQQIMHKVTGENLWPGRREKGCSCLYTGWGKTERNTSFSFFMPRHHTAQKAKATYRQYLYN